MTRPRHLDLPLLALGGAIAPPAAAADGGATPVAKAGTELAGEARA